MRRPALPKTKLFTELICRAVCDPSKWGEITIKCRWQCIFVGCKLAFSRVGIVGILSALLELI